MQVLGLRRTTTVRWMQTLQLISGQKEQMQKGVAKILWQPLKFLFSVRVEAQNGPRTALGMQADDMST